MNLDNFKSYFGIEVSVINLRPKTQLQQRHAQSKVSEYRPKFQGAPNQYHKRFNSHHRKAEDSDKRCIFDDSKRSEFDHDTLNDLRDSQKDILQPQGLKIFLQSKQGGQRKTDSKPKTSNGSRPITEFTLHQNQDLNTNIKNRLDDKIKEASQDTNKLKEQEVRNDKIRIDIKFNNDLSKDLGEANSGKYEAQVHRESKIDHQWSNKHCQIMEDSVKIIGDSSKLVSVEDPSKRYKSRAPPKHQSTLRDEPAQKKGAKGRYKRGYNETMLKNDKYNAEYAKIVRNRMKAIKAMSSIQSMKNRSNKQSKIADNEKVKESTQNARAITKFFPNRKQRGMSGIAAKMRYASCKQSPHRAQTAGYNSRRNSLK